MVSTWTMGLAMEFEELYEKYKKLLVEVNRLTEENSQLKAQLRLTKSEPPQINASSIKSEINYRDDDSINNSFSDVNNTSDSFAKISLFMSLFKGRDDVYAKRWENKNKGKFGYSPVCLNLWQAGVCKKPKISTVNLLMNISNPMRTNGQFYAQSKEFLKTDLKI